MRVSILLMILLISTGLFGCSYQEMASEKSVHAANKQKENTKNPAADAVEESSDFNLTLLGTGSPIFSMVEQDDIKMIISSYLSSMRG
ncbi:hypothetical protein ACIQXV_20440 [Neobacillus sp. NPDC097160]|uniref:hypothetical protein n=1 Tax=Neobacillus sp. NPDC097160 TaxID=3364298 RepID=UPI00382DC1A9